MTAALPPLQLALLCGHCVVEPQRGFFLGTLMSSDSRIAGLNLDCALHGSEDMELERHSHKP